MLRRWSFFRAIFTRFRPWQNTECDHNNNNHPHTWHGERIAWIGNINQSDARLKRRTTSTVELHQTWCEKGVRIEEHNHLRRRNYSIKTGWLRLRDTISLTQERQHQLAACFTPLGMKKKRNTKRNDHESVWGGYQCLAWFKSSSNRVDCAEELLQRTWRT